MTEAIVDPSRRRNRENPLVAERYTIRKNENESNYQVCALARCVTSSASVELTRPHRGKNTRDAPYTRFNVHQRCITQKKRQQSKKKKCRTLVNSLRSEDVSRLNLLFRCIWVTNNAGTRTRVIRVRGGYTNPCTTSEGRSRTGVLGFS